eukprot:TRINITY_DN24178_c0_g1_i1.p1 TRINITY_DN24178_c0_g1~~TRINITY_DN24178_c0_g1_i1.p1  ORF type:complete len:286 (+),score=42.09 TRINITY_DN24178_c0_g1_i1:104-961(+)
MPRLAALNKIAPVGCALLIVWVYVSQQLVVPQQPAVRVLLALLCLLAVSSFVHAATVKSFVPALDENFQAPAASRFCQVCLQPKPPRAHHCSTCRRCVLRMDHHCGFLDNCVGYNNHKSFLLMTIYIPIFCLAVFCTSFFHTFWRLAPETFQSPVRPWPVLVFLHNTGIVCLVAYSGTLVAIFSVSFLTKSLVAETTIESMQRRRAFRQAVTQSIAAASSSGEQQTVALKPRIYSCKNFAEICGRSKLCWWHPWNVCRNSDGMDWELFDVIAEQPEEGERPHETP